MTTSELVLCLNSKIPRVQKDPTLRVLPIFGFAPCLPRPFCPTLFCPSMFLVHSCPMDTTAVSIAPYPESRIPKSRLALHRLVQPAGLAHRGRAAAQAWGPRRSGAPWAHSGARRRKSHVNFRTGMWRCQQMGQFGQQS